MADVDKEIHTLRTLPRKRPCLRRFVSVPYDQGQFRAQHEMQTLKVVQEEGASLYELFLSEQIKSEGLPLIDKRLTEGEMLINSHADWAMAGSDLRILADKFADTQERHNVYEKANDLDISGIRYQGLVELLNELFAGGTVTLERVIVLFFFCADLAIRVLKEKQHVMFKNFISWTLQYIRDYLSAWIADHGGWGSVEDGSFKLLQSVTVVGGVLVAIFVLYQWWHRRAS